MLTRVRELSLGRMQIQRNAFGTIAFILAIVVLLLALKLFLYDEKIIIVPPEIERSFWVKGDHISKDYLEQMGVWFASLMLTKNLDNYKTNHRNVLKYIHPDSHGEIIEKLMIDEERYKKDNLETVFYPQTIDVDLGINEVVIEGELVAKIGGSEESRKQRVFIINFGYYSSRWFVNNFALAKKEDENA